MQPAAAPSPVVAKNRRLTDIKELVAQHQQFSDFAANPIITPNAKRRCIPQLGDPAMNPSRSLAASPAGQPQGVRGLWLQQRMRLQYCLQLIVRQR